MQLKRVAEAKLPTPWWDLKNWQPDTIMSR